MEPNFFLCPEILLLKPDQGLVVFYHRAHPWGVGHEILLACTLIIGDEHLVGQGGWGSFVKWCRILLSGAMAHVWRRVCGHACSPELCFFSFLRVEVPAVVCPCSWQAVGLGRAISVPEIWNFAHVSAGELLLLQRPHLHVPGDHYCSPPSTIYSSSPARARTTVCTLNGSRKLTGRGLVCVTHAA